MPTYLPACLPTYLPALLAARAPETLDGCVDGRGGQQARTRCRSTHVDPARRRRRRPATPHSILSCSLPLAPSSHPSHPGPAAAAALAKSPDAASQPVCPWPGPGIQSVRPPQPSPAQGQMTCEVEPILTGPRTRLFSSLSSTLASRC